MRYAQREGIASLTKVEEEAVKLAREAREETDDTEAKRKWARAYRLEKIVDLALWDAASDILERRTRGAFGGPLATIGVVLAVGGIGFVFATADWVKGERDRTAPTPAQAAVTCVAQIRDKNLAVALSKQLYAACAKLIKP